MCWHRADSSAEGDTVIIIGIVTAIIISVITQSLQMVICWGFTVAAWSQLQPSFETFLVLDPWYLAPQHRDCPCAICLLPRPQDLSLQGPARLQRHQGQTTGQPHSPAPTI